MGLFGFKKKKNVEFQINEDDRIWIEETINWLIGGFGLPNKNSELITFTEKYFPNALSNNEINAENIIKDLSDILELDASKISFEIQTDIRDTKNVPYEFEEFPLDSYTEKTGNEYKIHIANSLTSSRLLSRLIRELSYIKLCENELRFHIEDNFLYITAVYLGFGTILSQNLFDIGYSTDGFWETNWSNSLEIPQEMLAYSFALYLKIIGCKTQSLQKELPSDFFKFLNSASEYVDLYPSDLLCETELKANDLYFQAQKLIKNHEYESATSKLNEIIYLSENEREVSFISYVFERLGYIKIREGNFAKSISDFQKALEIDSGNFIATDNIAYALIKMGKIKEGKKYIDKSLLLWYKDMGAIYRNLALYFWAKGNFEEAEENFALSFESVFVPVFLLELDYSKFLSAKGEKEKSNEYLQLSIAKKEPEAMKMYKTQ